LSGIVRYHYMEYRILGRTGLSVSVAGLGCGGPSRLGLRYGRSEDEAATVVRAAIDAGINFLDTAEAYGTEGAVGKGIQSIPRESLVLSTKIPAADRNGTVSPHALSERLEACLTRLQTDYVDILHLHGVSLKEYDRACSELVPALRRLQEAGKIRFLGITEAFGPDPSHLMLQRAIQDDCWDVMMVGFNLLNHSARETVFPTTIVKNIGILCMFAVRSALSQPENAQALIAEMAEKGWIRGENFDLANPLGFLTEAGIATSIPDAAYRYCRDEPGMHVILTGTGNIAHLHENIISLTAPALPPPVCERLNRLFAGVDQVSGN